MYSVYLQGQAYPAFSRIEPSKLSSTVADFYVRVRQANLEEYVNERRPNIARWFLYQRYWVRKGGISASAAETDEVYTHPAQPAASGLGGETFTGVDMEKLPPSVDSTNINAASPSGDRWTFGNVPFHSTMPLQGDSVYYRQVRSPRLIETGSMNWPSISNPESMHYGSDSTDREHFPSIQGLRQPVDSQTDDNETQYLYPSTTGHYLGDNSSSATRQP